MLLALLLLIAQHAAALHAFEHAHATQGDGAPVPELSSACLGLHGIDDTPAPPRLAGSGSHALPRADATVAVERRDTPPVGHYESRAPPARS
ncbi:MAG: hypothetical protein JNM90_11340 [Burkholderiales bacterium]|nr:hypothetical protein [Burkholderiales bacterium]